MLQLCLMRVGQPDLEMTSKSEIEALHMKKVAAAAAAAKLLLSRLTLCDPIDSSPPRSPVPGILQARTGVDCHSLLQCVKVKSLSHV